MIKKFTFSLILCLFAYSSSSQKFIPEMRMPEPMSEDPVAPTQFDFKRRDSLGIKIRDFPTIMRETVEWIKSKPF